MRATVRVILVLLVSVTLDLSLSVAATMNDYCIVPPFIQEIAKPNLLMVIDNSASMYDLTYVDKGRKVCSGDAALFCTSDTECSPAKGTCTTFVRDPYYCYDQTYSTANTYVGYFDTTKKYQYNFTSHEFTEVNSIPENCAIAAAANVVCKIRSNVIHVNINTTDDTASKYFYASGQYLNWVTASKFDVEKQVLTGGKYVTKVCSSDSDRSCIIDGDCPSGTCVATASFLQPESRGCVGYGYVKEALTGDFINYSLDAENTNVSLQIVFTVQGTSNEYNSSAPAYGGQTYINLFGGKDYDFSKCQDAIDAIASGTNAEIKQNVDSCLATTAPTTGYCQQDPPNSCTTSSQCMLNTSTTDTTTKVCSSASNIFCTSDAECSMPATTTCSLDSSRTCSSDTDCSVTVTEKLGTCGNYSPTLSQGATNQAPSSCRTDADCSFTHSKTNYSGTCSGYIAPTTNNYGTCLATGAQDFGPCVDNYTGPCVLEDAATKTKVAFQQSMQACWQVREGKAIGVDDMNTVINFCSDVYGNYKTCSNDSHQTCTSDASCGTGTCLTGPLAIGPGNPALICGAGYEGQFYEPTGINNAWVLKEGYSKNSQEMMDVHTQFCNDFNTPTVTDPTDSPSDTATADNLPAILSGIGVESQMGPPLAKMRARVAKASAPSKLVQEYGNKIRIGLMAFNTFGSATEVASTLLDPTKVCSNDADKTCTQDLDCGPGNTCVNAVDRDGASILSLIGKGRCLTKAGTGTGTACTKQAHCTTVDESCVSDGVGDHAAGLVRRINDLRGATWTPFSEAYYNAIGYFAVSPADATGKSSRTDLRINATDFPASMNPSEYVCQANNILLVTDGSSTADQNSSKTNLVNVYKSLSGNITGDCSRYAGSQDLDDMTWLGRQRNINIFSTLTASADVPQKKNQSITSYVVFNGSDDGQIGDCNNTTLLTKTAANGGTSLLKTDIPEQYEATLKEAFEQVAGGTASGTAASILSNSEGSGANILQAVFYPSKDFEKETDQLIPTSANWIGEMQNLWYYVDPFVGNSSVREDTNINKNLDIRDDYVVEFQYMGGETIAALKKDTDGDGDADIDVTTADDPRVKNQGYCINSTTPASSSNAKCTSNVACQAGETCVIQGVVSADDISSLWRAGKQLWNRNLATAPRKLYTHLYGKSLSGCAGAFSINGMFDLGNWASLSANDKCIVKTMLQAADDAEAWNIIKFVQGYDHSSYDSSAGAITGTIDSKTPRSRSVQIGGVKKVWKLGDIIASTPRIQSYNKLNNFHMDAPVGYGDTTYADDSSNKGFANSASYKARGMAYTGANDGMLHAFTLGKLNVSGSGDQKATLTGTELGEEAWSFIPSNVLPYLKYLADPEYSHLFLVDGPTRLIDASIGYNDNSYITDADRAVYAAAGCNATGSGEHTAYWACRRDGTTTTDTVTNQSWRSILIGSMGVGGASANKDTGCTNCVKTPVDGVGYSSYFALDITDPGNPKYLWEFSDPQLGYATSGVGIARVSHKFSTATDKRNDTNGRWFAVIGNGPTGPIDTTYHQFKGKSMHDLGVFVLDLKSGILQRKLATSIPNAFAGSMSTAPIDTDRSKKYSSGFYSDDALYFGYTTCTNNCDAEAPTWNGGIMRLLTDENINPDTWSLTTLLSNTGPINTSVNKLQDRKNHNLWLYTGTGRYFFKGDDSTAPGKILAVKEPCYNKVNDDLYTLVNATANGCANEIVFAAGDFADQTTVIDAVDGKKGWFITLYGEDAANNYGAERIITEPVAMPNGAVFFTSFMPSTDVCNFGGNSYLWGMRYDTGGTASPSQLKGKALVQVSTGSFEEINLSSALTANMGRKMGTPMVGKPPTDPPPIVSGAGNKPLKRILHVREK